MFAHHLSAISGALSVNLSFYPMSFSFSLNNFFQHFLWYRSTGNKYPQFFVYLLVFFISLIFLNDSFAAYKSFCCFFFLLAFQVISLSADLHYDVKSAVLHTIGRFFGICHFFCFLVNFEFEQFDYDVPRCIFLYIQTAQRLSEVLIELSSWFSPNLKNIYILYLPIFFHPITDSFFHLRFQLHLCQTSDAVPKIGETLLIFFFLLKCTVSVDLSQGH